MHVAESFEKQLFNPSEMLSFSQEQAYHIPENSAWGLSSYGKKSKGMILLLEQIHTSAGTWYVATDVANGFFSIAVHEAHQRQFLSLARPAMHMHCSPSQTFQPPSSMS